MTKSIIVYGVPESGVRYGKRMAEHLGLVLVPPNDGSLLLPYGYLYLIAAKNPLENDVCECRSFQEVADEINASIPLTDWQSGPPPMVGEWEARKKGFSVGDTQVMRWWDGWWWSIFYTKDESQNRQNGSARHRSWFAKNDLEWRGLSQEPIKVTE